MPDNCCRCLSQIPWAQHHCFAGPTLENSKNLSTNSHIKKQGEKQQVITFKKINLAQKGDFYKFRRSLSSLLLFFALFNVTFVVPALIHPFYLEVF